MPELADRHLRPDAEGHLAAPEDARPGVVRVAADPYYASTAAGQHLLWMLVNLLVRQDGRLVQRLVLDIPDVLALPECLPYGNGETLAEALRNMAVSIEGHSVLIALGASNVSADIHIIVGAAHDKPAAHGKTFYAYGDGWHAYLGTCIGSYSSAVQSDSPLGPYFAACLAVGEVFKDRRGFRAGYGRFISTIAVSLLQRSSYKAWDELPDLHLHPPTNVVLAPLYLAGAGAVGQAVVLCLGMSPGVTGHMTVIDPQSLDDVTNLNRYILASKLGLSKAGIAASFAKSHGFTTDQYIGTWESFIDRFDRSNQKPELVPLEQYRKYEQVVSCVDDSDGNVARHAIQNVWPKIIFGGSTHGTGLRCTVSKYDMTGDQMCLKCDNPLRDAKTKLIEIKSLARKMSVQERQQWATDRGLEAHALEEFLTDPSCATVGLAQLSEYVDRPGNPNFSVGFTSVAAGILLARSLLLHSEPVTDPCSAFFYFLNPGARLAERSRNPTCDCNHRGKEIFKRTWQ